MSYLAGQPGTTAPGYTGDAPLPTRRRWGRRVGAQNFYTGGLVEFGVGEEGEFMMHLVKQVDGDFPHAPRAGGVMGDRAQFGEGFVLQLEAKALSGE